jgi:hypothetical protein
MKSALKVTAGFLVLLSNFMAMDSLAVVQPRHYLGVLKGMQNDGSLGGVSYWLAGKEKKGEIVFSEVFFNGSGLINIDGQNINLKRVNVQYKNREGTGFRKSIEYKSKMYKVKLNNIRDISTAKDKKGCAQRIKVSLEINGNDGWRKRADIESAYDACG